MVGSFLDTELMRINNKQIKELQGLLNELTGIEYSPEEAQTAGLAIMRFVYVKELRKRQLKNKEISNEGIKKTIHNNK